MLSSKDSKKRLPGAQIVIDVINSPSFDNAAVMNFFRTSTRAFIAAAEAARVRHHIVLSIVGTDRLLESGYFRAKMEQEEATRSCAIPSMH